MSVIRLNRIILTSALLSLAAVASGCSSIDRLSQIGEKPKLTEIENPTTQPGYKPVQMPMPKPEQASYNANSLWRNGSRAFFKDQRAARPLVPGTVATPMSRTMWRLNATSSAVPKPSIFAIT